MAVVLCFLILSTFSGFVSAGGAGNSAAHVVPVDHASVSSPQVSIDGNKPPRTPQNVVFVSYFGRSHMIPSLEALAQLKLRGHNVTIITDHLSSPWIQPYGFHLEFVPDEVVKVFHERGSKVMELALDPKARFGLDTIVEHMMLPQHPVVYPVLMEMFQRLRPAYVLCDSILWACMDAADMHNISYSLVVSGIPPGASDAPYLVGWYSKYHQYSTTEALTFLQRVDVALIEPLVDISKVMGAFKKLTKLKKQLGINTASNKQRTSLTLINTFFGFEVSILLECNYLKCIRVAHAF
eukprot:jgi/Chrzof1/3387/Cz12g23160.t1